MNDTKTLGMRKPSIAAVLGATLALSVGAAGAAFGSGPSQASRKQRKPAPTMVVSPVAEIAAWNAKVDAINELHFHRHEFKRPKLIRGSGQHPKFPKERKHRQHSHPQRDEHGAYTLVGKPYELVDIHPTSRESVLRGGVDPDGGFDYTVQRKWLAGVSAQRGY